MEKIYKTWADELKAEFKTELKRMKEHDLKRTLPAVLTREQCKKLYGYYSGKKVNYERNYLVIRILYSTGIRIAELENLKFCDINYENQTIFIRQGKGNKDRYVIADKETLDFIKSFQNNKELNEKLFNVAVRQLRNIVETAGDKTGIAKKFEAMDRKFSPHSLRHAFATHAFENGMRVFILKRLLGHEYMGTTQIYVNTATTLNITEYNLTNPINPQK